MERTNKKQAQKRKDMMRAEKKKRIPAPERKYSLDELKAIMRPQHREFASEYIRNGWDRQKAYRVAYPNVSIGTAYTRSCNLLKESKIQQYIEYMREDVEKLMKINVQKQLALYMSIAYADLTIIYNDWMTLNEWDDIVATNPEILNIIESKEKKTRIISTEDGKEIEVEYIKLKFHSRLVAADKIDQIMGYNKPVKVDNSISMGLGQGNVSAIREAFGLDK